ncbi:MAG: ABC transporter permease subunit [Candidatus Brocadiia bacterium]
MSPIFPIASNTFREVFRQPAFLLVLLLGVVGLILGRYLTLFALGDEVRMFKDIGVSTILLVGLVLVVISSTSTIFDEIENKTILTVLSKPVSRQSVLIGKFTGIALTVFVAFVMMTFVFLLALWWLSNFEYSHLPKGQPFFVVEALQGVYLAFLHVLLLAGISTVLSIHLSLLPNMAICCIIFVAGHLSDYAFSVFRDPSTNAMNPVAFVFYILIPNFEHFNVSSALIAGQTIPGTYTMFASFYAGVYLLILLFVGNYLFKRRELL